MVCLIESFPEETEIKIYSQLKTLTDNGCTYLYYTLYDGIFRNTFCAMEDWMEFYHQENLIENDPLKTVAENNPYSLLVTAHDNVALQNKLAKRVMQARESVGIHHGLTITKKNDTVFQCLVFATNCKDNDLASALLKDSKKLTIIFNTISTAALQTNTITQRRNLLIQTSNDARQQAPH